MAACRLASKGKTMADSSYDSEVQSILAFLSMQRPAQASPVHPNQVDFQPEDFISPRYLKKLKTKQVRSLMQTEYLSALLFVTIDLYLYISIYIDYLSLRFFQLAQRILEAHTNVRDMGLIDAKMNYIKAWQALPEYGITYFIGKLKGSKKEVSLILLLYQ